MYSIGSPSVGFVAGNPSLLFFYFVYVFSVCFFSTGVKPLPLYYARYIRTSTKKNHGHGQSSRTIISKLNTGCFIKERRGWKWALRSLDRHLCTDLDAKLWYNQIEIRRNNLEKGPCGEKGAIATTFLLSVKFNWLLIFPSSIASSTTTGFTSVNNNEYIEPDAPLFLPSFCFFVSPFFFLYGIPSAASVT